MSFTAAAELVGRLMEGLGVAIILVGTLVATARFLVQLPQKTPGDVMYRAYRVGLAQAILLGLEFLVAAIATNRDAPERPVTAGNLVQAERLRPARHERNRRHRLLGHASRHGGNRGTRRACVEFRHVSERPARVAAPNDDGLDGRKSGTIAGYNYSEANKTSGIIWSEESFLEYIRDPKARIPSTKMIFAGIRNEGEAKSLWAFLKQYDAEGKTK